MARKYKNFEIRLSDYTNENGTESCRVRVERSPKGEYSEEEIVTFSPDLRPRLALLDQRKLSYQEMLALGVDIGKILFPQKAKAMLQSCLPDGGSDDALRISVKCTGFALETIAWEFAAIERENVTDRTNFIVLNSNTSLVRYELLSMGRKSVRPTERDQIRFVGAFASPDGEVKLDFTKEKEGITEALDAVPRMKKAVFLERATPKSFINEISREPADIIHFAGHGGFGSESEASPGRPAEGFLLWEREDRSRYRYPSDVFAMDLADKKVKLVVFSACRSSQAEASNIWAGVAPALAKVGIPAVVGMQFSITDQSAKEFAYRFYRCLGEGKSLDEAVSEARKEILRDDRENRDFGVPVLYFRCDEDDSVLFPELPVSVAVVPQPAANLLPQNVNVSPILEDIERFSAYKDLHDALQNVKEGGLTRMQLNVVPFPEGNTANEYGHYAELFAMQLALVDDMVNKNKYVPVLAKGIHSRFSKAVDLLFDALTRRDAATLQRAQRELERLVTNDASDINTRLVECAERLELGKLIQALGDKLRDVGVDLAAGALAETQKAIDNLSSFDGEIRKTVDLHNVCQRLARTLVLIRSREPHEFKELTWNLEEIKTCVDMMIGNWSLASAARLSDCVKKLEGAVTNSDESAAREAFSRICSILDTGFSKVDTDLKGLCGNLRTETVRRFPPPNPLH